MKMRKTIFAVLVLMALTACKNVKDLFLFFTVNAFDLHT